MEESNQKILLVDDEKIILDTYGIALKNNGFEVQTAQNGKQAIDLLKKQRFDFVILDVVMNKQDGIETLKKLKNDVDLKRVPILMLTNLSNDADKQELLKLGAAGYYVKAETLPNELIKIIKQII